MVDCGEGDSTGAVATEQYFQVLTEVDALEARLRGVVPGSPRFYHLSRELATRQAAKDKAYARFTSALTFA